MQADITKFSLLDAEMRFFEYKLCTTNFVIFFFFLKQRTNAFLEIYFASYEFLCLRFLALALLYCKVLQVIGISKK